MPSSILFVAVSFLAAFFSSNSLFAHALLLHPHPLGRVSSSSSSQSSTSRIFLTAAERFSALEEADEDRKDDMPPPMVDDPKADLLELIGYNNNNQDKASPMFGFENAKDTTKTEISKAANDLAGYVVPLERTPPFDTWTLLYTDAPDLLGLKGGPLSLLVGIQQRITSPTELEICLEYQPSPNMVSLLSGAIADLSEDRLEQAVVLEYDIGPMNKVDLKIKGTRITPAQRFASLPQPSLTLPGGLPFGGFTIIFNDGDLRIDRTTQGEFLFIYKRIES